MKKTIGIYVHIPFCIKKCDYCDFLSFPSDEAYRRNYAAAVEREIRQAEYNTDRYEVGSVFFGGGTPSVMEGKQLAGILEALHAKWSFANRPEITVEANPGTISRQKLAAYRAAGMNRLSFGLQSADDTVLRQLGRIHTFTQFLDNYQEARAAGWENINVDLMSALPGQTVSGYMRSLQQVAELEPEHISAYSLILEPGTVFYERYPDGEGLPDEDEDRELYWSTEEYLAGRGYGHYEISNYAKPGRECTHNVGYWQRRPYIGYGIGAASLIEETRTTNHDNPERYLQGDYCKEAVEHLTVTARTEEFMFLGLRLKHGISRRHFRDVFDQEFDQVYGAVTKQLLADGLLQEQGERLRLTKCGVDLSNYVFGQYLREAEDEM